MYTKHCAGKLISFDLALLRLSGNMKQKHKTLTPNVQGLASVRLHLYKHTHVHMLIPHALFEARQHQHSNVCHQVNLDKVSRENY